MTTVLVLVGVWTVSGLLTTYLMARAGHRHPNWLLIGLVLGPLGLPILYERAERRARLVAERESSATGEPTGLTVVFGLDGSGESEAAFEAAFRVLGERVRGAHLVEIVDFDSGADAGFVTSVEARLASCAQRCPTASVSTHVVSGQPAPALLAFAEEHGADVIVVGRRGRGMSTWLLGSVSGALMRSSTVPVLVGGYQSERASVDDADAGERRDEDVNA
ncbi:universal stress protein [Phytoactinopolyspora halotolerans]|uniref:Universal stress protein n=1 Tax=Phytoactinopolyspora halotolerans TaxID=1981512 RepID=A0A6L9S587_9ACTN|nr:universal stress protein [Phytoactinopolyspora halotolerans]NEE00625.1 universal stress protein [Phytoactinopolyspora halotolerans]